MRRRRQHLQVSTFPFLAVLLCAMGSLILVLLVMDRKGKRAVHARAQEQANQIVRERQREYDRHVAQRRKEVEAKKRAQRLAHEKKREALQARLLAEEQALEQELAGVQARLAEAARKLHEEEGGLEELRKQLETEKALLEKQQRDLLAARLAASGAARKMSASDEARARLTAELTRLEKQLADLAEKRKKDSQTFSVVPYHGKRGEDRRPIYVECNASGHVFHPEKKALSAREDLRDELKRRLEIQKERLAALGVTDRKPYVMLLVRPDGVARYYEMQAAAKELGVDFGYEFVEADWVLSYPDDKDLAQPSLAGRPPASDKEPPGELARLLPAVKGATASAGGGSPAVAVGAVQGLPASEGTAPPSAAPGPGQGPILGAGGGQGPFLGEAATASQGAGGALPGERASEGADPGGPSQGPVITLEPPTIGKAGGGDATVPRVDAPTLASPGGSSTAPGQPSVDGAMAGQPRLLAGAAPSKRPDESVSPPPLLPNITGDPGAKVLPGTAVAKAGPRGADKGGTSLGPAVPEPDGPKPSRQLRPARLGGEGEAVVFVECHNDIVIVHPSRRRVPIESLNHGPAYNPLVQAVRQQVQRRQSQARPDESVKVQVRFLVHRDGERTFHLAYPALDGIGVPMSRYTLQPWDDVPRIISEY